MQHVGTGKEILVNATPFAVRSVEEFYRCVSKDGGVPCPEYSREIVSHTVKEE
jgi:hypothetical protein